MHYIEPTEYYNTLRFMSLRYTPKLTSQFIRYTSQIEVPSILSFHFTFIRVIFRDVLVSLLNAFFVINGTQSAIE